MIAAAFAWKLDKIIIDDAQPVIATKPVSSEAIKVEKGKVAGLKQIAKGVKKSEEVITLEFQAYIGAEEEYDAVDIDGVPPIHEKISPCVHGDYGTVAIIVNSIPKVLNAPSGLVTMKDMPIPSATPEDMRKYVIERTK
jgi:4-hydroxy-tetrahydrodipicolinate reductase